MSTPFRLTCLQLNSGNELDTNLAVVRSMMREAAGNGAQFVLTPEYTLMMDGSGRVMRERALGADGAPALAELQSLAHELKAWLLAGSLTVRTDEERIANRSFLISAEGRIVATYDKIHMFDVTLPDGKVIRESSAFRPGDRAVVADTPWGRLGLTVCYDLRFPALFRKLAQAGAQFISVPSSFQRQTYGHTLIIDPWGEILAEGGEAPEIVYAEIDPARVAKVRGMMPSLEHDRVFQPPRAG